MLAEVEELYGALGEERGISLVVQTPPEVPAYGDKALIHQAIANLVDNAVKFSPPGGTVRLIAAAAGRVDITVTDEGPGIPESERARATDRFYRGETARSTPGSGLGLSLVAAVAQLHGGELRLEDNEPGLRAVLVLPNPEDPDPRATALQSKHDFM
jgi:signal transduction histidine kinase